MAPKRVGAFWSAANAGTLSNATTKANGLFRRQRGRGCRLPGEELRAVSFPDGQEPVAAPGVGGPATGVSQERRYACQSRENHGARHGGPGAGTTEPTEAFKMGPVTGTGLSAGIARWRDGGL
jgi:hypothetical protein